MKYSLIKVFAALAVLITAWAPLSAQNISNLTVEVSAVTGVSTQGLTVYLHGEAGGWVFDPVKVKADGTAKFLYVPDGVYTLTVDGSPLGLEEYVDNNLVHEGEQTVQVVLREAVRTPYALQASLSHDDFTGVNSALFSWNRETDYFFDDFESYEPFSIDFAPWTGHDLDKEAAAEISGLYPNRGIPQYATIFNALTIDPPVYYEYEVLRPYSGKQYVGFVRTRSGAANNDWLISPKIKVGVNNIVSFMAKASEYVPDRFAVCISTTGTEVKDFVQLTAGNYQTVDYKQWYEITYDLSKYEGQEVYIAIHCMSQGSFMFMVDDFYVGPKSISKMARRVNRRSADNPNEKFIVTLDGNKVGETEELTYTFENLSAGAHTLGVTATYVQSVSDEAAVTVDVPGEDAFASLTVSVSGDIEAPTGGLKVSLLNSATARQTVTYTDAEGVARIPSLAKGEYLLNVASDIFDEYNSTVTLDGDKSVDVLLTEAVTDPFNLLYQTSQDEAGNNLVELWWNQDLGYRESFEDYEDFALTFGDWTTIDVDKMPTYAFQIGSALLTVPESRQAIAAMVFNPYATQPVQASDDGLFIAPDGDKYVMFNSAEMAWSDDWLISPTQKIGKDYVLRFTAKSYQDIYPGFFEFYALKDKDIVNPDLLDQFYLTSDWLRYEIDLSKYEGESIEVAFHHTTYDGWLSFIDDVYVGPGEESTGGSQDSGRCTFDIFLDRGFVANTSEPYFAFANLTEGTHTLGVQAVYPSGKRSAVTEIEVAVDTNGVSSIAPGESGDALYFDLHGLPVNPDVAAPGIYIRIVNGFPTKIRL